MCWLCWRVPHYFTACLAAAALFCLLKFANGWNKMYKDIHWHWIDAYNVWIHKYEEVFRNISKLGTKVHYEFHFPALLSITLPNSNFRLIRDQKEACALRSISHIHTLVFPAHVWMLQSTSDSIASESMSIISSDRVTTWLAASPGGDEQIMMTAVEWCWCPAV